MVKSTPHLFYFWLLALFCWYSNATVINEPCLTDIECNAQTPYSYCDTEEGVCACPWGRRFFPDIPDKCLLLGNNLGDSCFEHERQCINIPSSICDSSFACKCNEDTHVKDPYQTNCLPKAGFEAACNQTIQCQVENTICHPIRSRCECDQFHIKSETSQSCLKIASAVGSNCVQTSQCTHTLGSNAICNEATAKCECSTGTILLNGKCYHKKDFMEECIYTEQCTSLNSKCIYNSGLAKFICDCPKRSLRASGQCHPIKAIEDDCTTDQECTVQGSSCSSSKCTCSSSYVVSNDKTKCLDKRRVNEACQESAQCISGDENIICGPSGLCQSIIETTTNSGVTIRI